MINISLQQTVTADMDTVWSVVGDLARFAAFDPEVATASVLRGEGVDAIVRLVNHAGQVWEERCVEFEPGRCVALRAEPDSLPFPFAQRSRRLSFASGSDGVVLSYDSDYATRLGPFGALNATRRRQQSLARQALEGIAHDVRSSQWRHKITVQSILARKGESIVSALPDATVADVAGLLESNRIGAVLIIDHHERLLGLVSERDITYGLARSGSALLAMRVDSIMTTNLIVCAPEHDMEFVMVCMTDKRVRHLPVMDEDRLCGIVSIGDVVLQRISALEAESQTMREYIESREWRYHNLAVAEADGLPIA
jgi:CBS domain-containing protein